MSALAIKMIACATMLIDHVAVTLQMVGILPAGPLYEGLRLIGRLAFPLFCFQLALGVMYSRSRWKYGLRLFAFALISEAAFDFALFGGITFFYQNVYFTLLLGFLATLVLKWATELPESKRILGFLLWLAAVLLAAWLAESVLRTDYGAAGVLAIAVLSLSILPADDLMKVFGSVRTARMIFFAAAVLILTFMSSTNEYVALLGLIPIGLYNEKRGYRGEVIKWCGYAFYPVHLALLAFLFVVPRLV